MFKGGILKGAGGTNYTVVAAFENAVVGYAKLGDGNVRVRVEILNDGAQINGLGSGWTQPGGPSYRRYSKVVSTADAPATVVAAVKAAKTAQVSLDASIKKALAAAGF